jgi:hypothetical protein
MKIDSKRSEVLKSKPQRLNEELLHIWAHISWLWFWKDKTWQEERDTLKVYNKIWRLYSDLQAAESNCWTCTGGRQFGIFSPKIPSPPKTPTRKPFANLRMPFLDALAKRLFCTKVSGQNRPSEVLNQPTMPAESRAEAEADLLP